MAQVGRAVAPPVIRSLPFPVRSSQQHAIAQPSDSTSPRRPVTPRRGNGACTGACGNGVWSDVSGLITRALEQTQTELK